MRTFVNLRQLAATHDDLRLKLEAPYLLTKTQFYTKLLGQHDPIGTVRRKTV